MSVLDFAFKSVQDGVVTGLPFTLAFLGVWLVFRLQRDFDLTVDGTFSVGAAASAAWIFQGHDPFVGLLLSAIAGALGGLVTYTIMRTLQLPLILSSLVVGLGLYSVALWFMQIPDINLIGKPTIFQAFAASFGLDPKSPLVVVAVAGGISGVLYFAVSRFLRSEAGLAFRASGMNPTMARSLGIVPERMLLVAVIACNALAGTSGGLLAQQQGFADYATGTGVILYGVTAVLLGEVVTGGFRPTSASVLPVLLGALLYRTLLAGAYRLGIDPLYFQAMTAIVVIASVAIGQLPSRLRARRSARRLAMPSGSLTSNQGEASIGDIDAHHS